MALQMSSLGLLLHLSQRAATGRAENTCTGEECKRQVASIFSAWPLGLSPAFKVMSEASRLRELGGGQGALTLAGSGLKLPSLPPEFSWKAHSLNNRGYAVDLPCGLSGDPGFLESALGDELHIWGKSLLCHSLSFQRASTFRKGQSPDSIPVETLFLFQSLFPIPPPPWPFPSPSPGM